MYPTEANGFRRLRLALYVPRSARAFVDGIKQMDLRRLRVQPHRVWQMARLERIVSRVLELGRLRDHCIAHA